MRVSVLSYMRAAMLAAMLMLVVGSAFAAPPAFVYRGSNLPPEQVFQNGFPSPGINNDVYEHVGGNSCMERTSAFVPTSAQESVAHQFASRWLVGRGSRSYVYRIRATARFYSAYASLRDAYTRLGNVIFRTTAERFRHEDEWMAFSGVPNNLVESVQIFERNADTGQMEVVAEQRNPAYVAGNTVANQDPFPIRRAPTTTVQLVAPALAGTSGALASVCSLCNITEEEEEDRRRKRSVDVSTGAKACNYFSIREDDSPAAVVDPITGEEVKRYVPWQTRVKREGYSSIETPLGCQTVTGAAPLADLVAVKCDGLRNVRRFRVSIGAGGNANTWVDKRFDDGVEGEWWGRKSSEIPVVNTRYTLADYGYSIYDVFGNTTGNWWSGLTVRPFYPDLPYTESGVCAYDAARHKTLLLCLPPSGIVARLEGRSNNAISSIEAPADHAYKICEDAGFAGRCHILRGDASQTDLGRLGMNDNISSIRACYKPVPNSWRPAPDNRGLIGTVYYQVNATSGLREYYQLNKSSYGPMPASQRSNADWTYLPDYDEC
ncbi:Pertussis toxin, subunit 1 [Ralstonia sp. 25mfcol4.1]|uniref:hypothetical protein n=1 Tax=Burkholderiaceae TaxID=119060 RepID=UPI00088EF6CB|nr:hypothetical protein [Ralstonia sp. 25mfcol4.1]SDO82866.1 Pertussis toxin, subunit 1 [Ralstonia sp. 25mfcol4.1]